MIQKIFPLSRTVLVDSKPTRHLRIFLLDQRCYFSCGCVRGQQQLRAAACHPSTVTCRGPFCGNALCSHYCKLHDVLDQMSGEYCTVTIKISRKPAAGQRTRKPLQTYAILFVPVTSIKIALAQEK